MRGYTASLFHTDMRFRDELKEILIQEEGYKRVMYTDTKGVPTVGVGHNLAVPLSDAAIEQMLEDDLSSAQLAARNLYNDSWIMLPRPVKAALVLMAFQLGKAGLAKFVKMKALIEGEEYVAAADEALDSDWAKQTPERAKRVAALIARGAE